MALRIQQRIQKGVLWGCCMGLIAAPFFAFAAAPRKPADDESSLRALKTTLETLRHQVRNHEEELRIFNEKLANQDATVEALRQQTVETQQAHKEQLKGNSSALEHKITALETTNKGLIADLKQLKEHFNESVTALTQYGQKITQLEKLLEGQNQNIANLEVALGSMLEAAQLKTLPAKEAKTYTVKSGDSLGKIAQEHQTTIQAIKELNGLSSNQINIGQTLRLP